LPRSVPLSCSRMMGIKYKPGSIVNVMLGTRFRVQRSAGESVGGFKIVPFSSC
jgi:hypothetical protein